MLSDFVPEKAPELGVPGVWADGKEYYGCHGENGAVIGVDLAGRIATRV